MYLEKTLHGAIHPEEIGFISHIVADSYSNGHVRRDSYGKIVIYNNYSKQDSDEHKKYDRRYPKPKKNEPKWVRDLYKLQEKSYENARKAIIKLLKALYNEKTTEKSLRRLLEKEIFIHTKKTKRCSNK